MDKFLAQLTLQLADKNVQVEFSESMRQHLAEKGFDPHMGARPMNRLIQNDIRKVLADELLFGALVNGGFVWIDWVDDKTVLSFKKKRSAARKQLMKDKIS